MHISEEGLCLIKKFEGCEMRAYTCAAGVPTIAYGRTKNVKMGDTCTKEQAEEWLKEEINEYFDAHEKIMQAYKDSLHRLF